MQTRGINSVSFGQLYISKRHFNKGQQIAQKKVKELLNKTNSSNRTLTEYVEQQGYDLYLSPHGLTGMIDVGFLSTGKGLKPSEHNVIGYFTTNGEKVAEGTYKLGTPTIFECLSRLADNNSTEYKYFKMNKK